MAGILSGDKGRLPNGKSIVGFAVGWMSSFGALIAVYACAQRLASLGVPMSSIEQLKHASRSLVLLCSQ